MSAYVWLLTPMPDRACLLRALADVGFGHNRVELHDSPAVVVSDQGGQRAQVAHVVIRRGRGGSGSNDLGFLATPTGHVLVVSPYDQARFGPAWMQELVALYSHHARVRDELATTEERRLIAEVRRKVVEAQRRAVTERAKKMGYQVQEQREGEKVRLVLVRRLD